MILTHNLSLHIVLFLFCLNFLSSQIIYVVKLLIKSDSVIAEFGATIRYIHSVVQIKPNSSNIKRSRLTFGKSKLVLSNRNDKRKRAQPISFEGTPRRIRTRYTKMQHNGIQNDIAGRRWEV